MALAKSLLVIISIVLIFVDLGRPLWIAPSRQEKIKEGPRLRKPQQRSDPTAEQASPGPGEELEMTPYACLVLMKAIYEQYGKATEVEGDVDSALRDTIGTYVRGRPTLEGLRKCVQVYDNLDV